MKLFSVDRSGRPGLHKFCVLQSVSIQVRKLDLMKYSIDHIVLKIALSQTNGLKVCGSISDWIRAQITQF